uniref:Uncharacterized protein n=1 Tax=Rhizophora mucronata TaxID=61149 RepID=A0A2P2PIU8_RHIMU
MQAILGAYPQITVMISYAHSQREYPFYGDDLCCIRENTTKYHVIFSYKHRGIEDALEIIIVKIRIMLMAQMTFKIQTKEVLKATISWWD